MSKFDLQGGERAATVSPWHGRIRLILHSGANEVHAAMTRAETIMMIRDLSEALGIVNEDHDRRIRESRALPGEG